MESEKLAQRVPIRELVRYYLRLGLIGFGGPVALVGQMERELVADRKWLTNVQGFIKGAYAAAIGTILGACVLLGRIAIGDWLTALVALVSLVALFRWKVSNPCWSPSRPSSGSSRSPCSNPNGFS
jgi:chromate transport protein ChrA